MCKIKNIMLGILFLLLMILYFRKNKEGFDERCDEEIEDEIEAVNKINQVRINDLNRQISALNSQLSMKDNKISDLNTNLSNANDKLDSLKYNPIIDEETDLLLQKANETISDLLIKKKLDEQRIKFCNRKEGLSNFQVNYALRQNDINNLKSNIKELVDDAKDFSDQDGNIYLNHVQKQNSNSPSQLIPSTF